MTMPSIRDSFLFQEMNKNSHLDNLVSDFMKKGIKATPDKIQFALDSINRYFKFPLKLKVMDAYKNGLLELYYAPPGLAIKMPPALPFRLYQTGLVKKAAVFIDNYVDVNKKTGEVTIEPKKLYCYMEGAYIALCLAESFKSITRNTVILTDLSSIYAHMFARVLNKRFALNVYKRSQSKVLFLAAKFFLIKHLGMSDDQTTFNYALKVSSDLSPIMVRELNDAFTTESFKDISTLVTAMSDKGYLIINGLKDYTVRAFVEEFVDMYSSTAIFALEDLSYLLFNVFSAVNGGFVNKQYVFDDIIGNSGGKIYSTLEKYAFV